MRTIRHLAILALLLLALLSTTEAGLTYWIDRTSCDSHPGVEPAVREAILMAALSDQRLSWGDSDFQAIYQRIFNAPVTNRVYADKVHNVVRKIGGMTPELLGRELANVRIYCDDERWTLQPDRDVTLPPRNHVSNPYWDHGRYRRNSKRDVDSQIWIDKDNGMISRGNAKACSAGQGVKGMTHSAPMATEWYQNPLRDTITLCAPYIDTLPTVQSLVRDGWPIYMHSLSDILLANTLSHTVLHELTHTQSFRAIDVTPAYGWKNVIAKPPPDATKNAENYAFLGLLAVLDLAGCQLDMDTDDPRDGYLKPVDYFHVDQGLIMPITHLREFGYAQYLPE